MPSFDDYKKLAADPDLASYEKVGFGAQHRKDTEAAIFPDVLRKLPRLGEQGITVVDIGCGCSLPVQQLIEHCTAHRSRLVLVDSAEMLANLPDIADIEKHRHQFPNDQGFLDGWRHKADVVICYSVAHVIYPYQNVFSFVDSAASLLRSGGQMLVGDLPNLSKKSRFLSSETGKAFHRSWSGEEPPTQDRWTEYDGFDDSVVLHLMLRYRSMGMETYLLPQTEGLPMNNTREDLLVCKW